MAKPFAPFQNAPGVNSKPTLDDVVRIIDHNAMALRATMQAVRRLYRVTVVLTFVLLLTIAAVVYLAVEGSL